MMKRIWFCAFIVCLITGCWRSENVREVSVSGPQGSSLNVEVAGIDNAVSGKLVFIQHGLSSNREHSAVKEAKRAFLDDGYVVVSFDSRYSSGKSGNEVEKARLSTFVEDLEAVINWARQRYFYAEPFALAGHSLGGASVISYAMDNQNKVNYLVGITPVVSGQSWENSCKTYTPKMCRQWKKNGSYSYQADDKTITLSYDVIEEAKAYDAIARAQDIKTNTLLVAAERDKVIAPKDVRQLYNALGKPKQLSVIKRSDHNFGKQHNQKDLYNAIKNFLQNLK